MRERTGNLTEITPIDTVGGMPRKTKISAAAAALGRKGGAANTDAQNAARRANGEHGGRPTKLRTLAGVEVHAGAALAGKLTDGRPAFVATSPTAARWLARNGYTWAVRTLKGAPLVELPRGGAWAK
jgi:hypothetical protein